MPHSSSIIRSGDTYGKPIGSFEFEFEFAELQNFLQFLFFVVFSVKCI